MTKQRAVQYANAAVYVSQDIQQILNNRVLKHVQATLAHS